jgi:hypothetical protein
MNINGCTDIGRNSGRGAFDVLISKVFYGSIVIFPVECYLTPPYTLPYLTFLLLMVVISEMSVKF